MIMEDLSPASAACSRYLKPFIRFPALSCERHKNVGLQPQQSIVKAPYTRKRVIIVHLQFHIWQYVMGQLQVALPHGYNGLQLSAQRGSLQMEHGRVLVPLLILLAEATCLVVTHHRQVDLDGRKEIQDITED